MTHDKAFWKAIAAADYAVPDGESVRALTAELLACLGSPDSELRDDIAYTTMAHWATRGVLSPDDLRFMLHTVGPNMMRPMSPAAILSGESDADGILLRSFSALTLSLVAYCDWKTPFSEQDEFEAMMTIAEAYFLTESDLRGYVDGIGWIHATAHTADVFKFLARNRYITAENLHSMLNTIAIKLVAALPYIYTHSEDERVAMAVVDIAKRDMLTAEQLAAFVTRLSAVTERDQTEAFDPVAFARYMNVKNFLRALYFRLRFADPPVTGAHDLGQRVEDALRLFKA